jgi:hypothetical protein
VHYISLNKMSDNTIEEVIKNIPNIEKYTKEAKWKDIKLKTKTGVLYYSKYKLADASKYFEKLFDNDMMDTKNNTIDFTEYSKENVILLLTFIDNKEYITEYTNDNYICENILSLINYYQFKDILDEIIQQLKVDNYNLSHINSLYLPEYLEGIYASEFKDLFENLLNNFVENTETEITEYINDVKSIKDINGDLAKLLICKLISHSNSARRVSDTKIAELNKEITGLNTKIKRFIK